MRNQNEPEGAAVLESGDVVGVAQVGDGSAAVPSPRRPLLMTVEQVAMLWFGEVGDAGSASAHCQRIRRLIPDRLPAQRIGNRWYVIRAAAEAWAASSAAPAMADAHAQAVARS